MKAAMKAAVAGLTLAVGLLASCRGGDERKMRPEATGSMTSDGRIECAAANGQRYGMTVERVASPSAELLERLEAATSINVDAPGLEPAAASLIPTRYEKGGEATGEAALMQGAVLWTNEPGISASFDGYRAEPLALVMYAGNPGTTFCMRSPYRKLAAGLHSVRVEKQGYFPLETQVLVRPGTVEVLAVRMGRAVSRSSLVPQGGSTGTSTPVRSAPPPLPK